MATGLGIGTGGLGVGIGGGTYSEHGEEATKRANVFREPQRYALPVILIIVLGGFASCSFSQLPYMVSVLAPDNTAQIANTMTLNLTASLEKILTILAPICAFGMIVSALLVAVRNAKENTVQNHTRYPQELKRYNELLYCEACHSLYDRVRGKPSPFRAGKDSADGVAVLVFDFSVASAVVRCTGGQSR